MASSSNSPCAACKFLRRKCIAECVFAPYFPPDQPQKFANVHKVFGASNISKILSEIVPSQREDAVNSLAYEAEARLRDPIYGCVRLIANLQQHLKDLQTELFAARTELSKYMGSAGLAIAPQPTHPLYQQQHQFIQPHPHMQFHNQQQHHQNQASCSSMGGLGINLGGTPREQMMLREHQQLFESQQMAVAAAAREQQEMMRGYDHDIARLGGGSGYDNEITGFNHLSAASSSSGIGQLIPFQLQPQPPEPPDESSGVDTVGGGSGSGRGSVGPSS